MLGRKGRQREESDNQKLHGLRETLHERRFTAFERDARTLLAGVFTVRYVRSRWRL